MNVLAENYIDKSNQMRNDLIKKAAMSKISKSVAKNVIDNGLKQSIEAAEAPQKSIFEEEPVETEQSKEPMFEAERKKKVIFEAIY